jgi:hypothetical protein
MESKKTCSLQLGLSKYKERLSTLDRLENRVSAFLPRFDTVDRLFSPEDGGATCHTPLSTRYSSFEKFVFNASITLARDYAEYLAKICHNFLSARIAPPVTVVIPLFLLFRSFNLIDTHVALISAYVTVNMPFAIWMIKGFFDEIPKELMRLHCSTGAPGSMLF